VTNQIKEAAFGIGSKFIFFERAERPIGAETPIGAGQVKFLTLFAVFRTGPKGMSDPVR